MAPLLVLSLWQPHATLCVARDPAYDGEPGACLPRAPKKYETRHWAPRIPTPFDVVIHATKRWGRAERDVTASPEFRNALLRCGFACDYAAPVHVPAYAEIVGLLRNLNDLRPLPLGALVGVVTVVKVVTTEEAVAYERRTAAEPARPWHARRAVDVLHFGDFGPGRFAWWLHHPRAFAEPIPFTGRQDTLYPLTGDALERVRAQLQAVPA